MADVFISYSRSDEKSAKRLANALETAGYSVWWDANLPAHRAYSDVIEAHLREAKAAIVLWSKEAVASQWVRAEADVARNEDKLVQLTLDGTLPPLPFNQLQCTSLKGWRGSASHAGWLKLEESIAELVGAVPRTASTASSRWWTQPKTRWIAAATAFFLVILAFAIPRYLGDDNKRPVVAVLPFQSLDDRDESLVAGIWEDTRQAISRNPQLLVLGPNSSEKLAEGDDEAIEKAADYVLEASVRSVGDRIRVNTNLIRTDDGAQIWSENFDRKLNDVFALQGEIAQEIEGKIRGRLARSGGVQPQHIATSGEVYALYSDARTKIRKRDIGRYEEALGQLRKVVQMDPNFAPGWATLAVIKKFGVMDAEDRTAEADARRAVALAPNLAAAHAALGFVLQKGPAAEAALRRAITLDPNDFEPIHWLANSLDESQAPEKLRLYSKVVEIEPLWWPAVMNKLDLLMSLNDQTAVQGELTRVERLGDKNLAALIRMKQAEKTGDLSTVINIGLPHFREARGPEKELFTFSVVQALYQLGYFEIGDEIFPPPHAYIPYLRRNDPKALDMIEAQMPPRQFWSFGFLADVGGRVYLLNGQGPRMAGQYRAVASNPAEFESIVGRNRLASVAPLAALALRSAGDDRQAGDLLGLAESRATDSGGRSPERQVALARIHAVQGRIDVAMGELASAVREGWLPPYLPILPDIALDPPLAELKRHPNFQSIRQQILAHLAKERAEVGEISVTGRLAGQTRR